MSYSTENEEMNLLNIFYLHLVCYVFGTFHLVAVWFLCKANWNGIRYSGSICFISRYHFLRDSTRGSREMHLSSNLSFLWENSQTHILCLRHLSLRQWSLSSVVQYIRVSLHSGNMDAVIYLSFCYFFIFITRCLPFSSDICLLWLHYYHTVGMT